MKIKRILQFTYKLFATAFISNSILATEINYENLINKYNELTKIQKENFDGLDFKLANNQLKKSVTYKYVFEDQFKRLWLFKAGPHSSRDGALAIFKLYQATGLDTPETHIVELNLNGENVSGSMQRFIDAEEGVDLTGLNQSSF